MSDGMGRELAYLSSHATNRYFIPNWGILYLRGFKFYQINLNPLIVRGKHKFIHVFEMNLILDIYEKRLPFGSLFLGDPPREEL